MLVIKPGIFEQFPDVGCGFSTRKGLSRQAPFFFNLSLSVGDAEQTVQENRNAFFTACGIQPQRVAFQKQVHEADVRIVSEPGFNGESDAMITREKNIGLAVSTADCVPVFIYDRMNRVIAAVHSGWRSTALGITAGTIKKMVSEFGCSTANMYCYIGPCIHQNCFQVGEDVAAQFDVKYSYRSKDKYYIDLVKINSDMLTENGIPESNIQSSELCSFETKNLLHSYRRDGAVSGRAYGVIFMRKELHAGS